MRRTVSPIVVTFSLVALAGLVAPAQAAQSDEKPAEEAPAQTGEESAPEATAEDAEPPCSSPEHHQFDFWIGSWEVHEPDGSFAGTNRIEPLFGGCVLRESWEGASGSVGTSLNLYDAARGVWHQTWVDGRGGLLELEGGLDGDAMVMRGERPSRQDPGVTVLHEIRWDPLEEGKVRQLWRASKDGGESWQVLFEGIYSPAS